MPPQPKPRGSGGQRPPAKIENFSNFSLGGTIFQVGTIIEDIPLLHIARHAAPAPQVFVACSATVAVALLPLRAKLKYQNFSSFLKKIEKSFLEVFLIDRSTTTPKTTSRRRRRRKYANSDAKRSKTIRKRSKTACKSHENVPKIVIMFSYGRIASDCFEIFGFIWKLIL